MRSLTRYLIYLGSWMFWEVRVPILSARSPNADPEDQDEFADYLLATPGDPRQIRAWLQRNIHAQKTAPKNGGDIE